ncbi:MAG: M15 family metallopeptidase [Pseudomonadota bacterium]
MLLIAVALYFILACLISWLALFPAGRRDLAHAIARGGEKWQARLGHAALGRVHALSAFARACVRRSQRCVRYLRHHKKSALAATAILCLPALLALLVSNKNMLAGFDSPEHAINAQVASLLQGEQLVPPQALPPLIFATREVELLRPMLASASRNWSLLNADYAQRLLLAFKIMREKYGYEMAILEGYRSPERQTMLAALGPQVTNAAPYQSWHQYGLAADCAFLREGKLLISEKDAWAMRGYQLYGEVAESLGLSWGGRWKMMDFGHTELRLPGVMARR